MRFFRVVLGLLLCPALLGAEESPASRAAALMAAGERQHLLAQWAETRRSFEEALAIGKQASDRLLCARAHLGLGELELALGKPNDSIQHGGVALARFYEENDPWGKAWASVLLARAYLQKGENLIAARTAEKALELAVEQESAPLLAASGVVLAEADFRRGWYQRARKQVVEAINAARQAQDKSLEADSLRVFGLMEAYSGMEQTEKYLDASLSLFRRAGDKLGETRTLAGLAEMWESRGEPEEALKAYKLAVERRTALGVPADADHERIASLLIDLGRGDEAQAELERVARPGPMTAGRAALARRDFQAAEGHFARCAGDVRDMGRRFACLCGRGHAQAGLGRWRAAAQDYLAALEATEDHRRTLAVADRANFFTARVNGFARAQAYEGLVRASIESGKEEEAFQWSESLKARELAEAIARAGDGAAEFAKIHGSDRLAMFDIHAGARLAEDRIERGARSLQYSHRPTALSPYFDIASRSQKEDPVVRQSSEIGERVQKMEREQRAGMADDELMRTLARSLQAEDAAAGAPDAERQKELDKDRAELSKLIAKARKKFPSYAAARFAAPIRPEESSLDDSEVLLEFKVTAEKTYLFTLQGKGKRLKVREIPASREELRSLVLAYRAFFEGIDSAADLARFDLAAGKKLYDLLFADTLKGLSKDARLIIVPDEILALLPFEALVVDAPLKGRMGEGPHGPFPLGVTYLGDQREVTYALSATTLTLLRNQPTDSSQAGLALAVADPDFSRAAKGVSEQAAVVAEWRTMGAGGARRRGQRRPAAGPQDDLFPRLPRTREVAAKVRELFGPEAVVLTGEEASEPAVLKLPWERYRYVVFGTHGLLADSVPGLKEPALILARPGQGQDADGFLTAGEIMGLKIKAEVVALTACETGVGKSVTGEGVMGMGRAFQLAGAKDVMMSLWQVSEDGAVALTNHFLEGLKEGLPAREALSRARSQSRKAGFEHPFYWSAFILVSR